MAVYTPLSLEEAKHFFAQYNLGVLQECRGIAEGIENSNFLLKTDKKKYILTLFEKRVKEEELPFYTGLMRHLARAQFPCPEPIADVNGEMLKVLKHKPALIVSFLEGRGVCDPDTITPNHLYQLGMAVAHMHNNTENFSMHRANALSIEGWLNLSEKVRGAADIVADSLSNIIAMELMFLQQHWPKQLPRTVIHADLFPDNVFYQEDGSLSGVIDFYFACNDFASYELAVIMNAWCFNRTHTYLPERTEALLSGYESVRPLTSIERVALPILCRGAALRFLLTRTYDWIYQVEGALVTPKNPDEYIQKLAWFQQGAAV